MRPNLAFQDWPLRVKMAALLLFASALPIIASSIVEFRSARDVLREQGTSLLRARADEVAEQVDLFHEQYQRITQRVAGHQEVRDFLNAAPGRRGAAVPELLRRYAESDPNFRGAGILDAEGTVLAATEAPLLGRNYGFRAYLQQALKGSPATSEIYLAVPEIGSVPSIAYVAPVKNGSGSVVGVTALWVKADAFWRIVNRANGKAGEGSYSVLLDSYGIRVAHSRRQDLLYRPTHTLDPRVVEALVAERRFGDRTRSLLAAPFPVTDSTHDQAAKAGIAFSGYSQANEQRNLGVARPLRTVPWTLFYLVPQSSVDAPALTLVRETALVSGLILLLALGGGLLFAGRISLPVLQIAKAADALAAGDLAARIEVTSHDELGRLGATFNRMAGALASARDDLERRVEERTAELHRQKTILDSMLDNMGEGVVVADQAGHFLVFNPMAKRLLGKGAVDAPVGEWAGQYGVFAADAVAPMPTDELPLVRALRGEDTDDVEIVVKHPGLPRGVRLSCTGRVMRDAAGTPIGGVVVFQDVTERTRAQQALKVSEERFRTLSETANDAIVSADHRGLVTYVNPAGERIFACAAAEIVGQPITDLMPERFRAAHSAGLQRFVETGVARVVGQTVELVGLTHDGREFPLEFSLAAWASTEGTSFTAILRDISLRKAAEAELLASRREMESTLAQLAASNQELEAFSYSVSHDLRAPVRHIAGFADLLRKRSAHAMDETARRHLDTISTAARRMGQLIDDLLAFSRMGRSELMRTHVDLDAMARELVRTLSDEEPGRNVSWKTGSLPMVVGDPAMLRVVLTNLVSNALKYTRGRDPAEIELGAVPADDGKVTIFVRDNGAGFDMQYAHKLFGVFQRLHRAEEFEGTGIGLATVRRVVDRHGGSTWAEAVPGAGATFHFTLSLAEAA